MERRIKRWTLVLVLGLAVVAGGTAHASVNLPLHHWVYDAIDRLATMGLIDRAMITAKPYSRKQAAKYVAQAIDKASTPQLQLDSQEATVGLLLPRLLQEFQNELGDLGAVPKPKGGIGAGFFRYGGRLQVEGDAFFVGGGQTVRLRENRMGQYYANGPQLQSDLRAWFELTDAFSLTATPRFISDPNALGIGPTNNSQNFYMQELNAKLTLWNTTFQVGRSSLWWGPGYRGSLLLTDHAFPLDMVQLGSEEAFRLPWVFESLGDWKINSFLTQLERDRDFPRAKVFGLRLSYMPADWLELGLTRLTQFNGRGRDQSFPSAVTKAYFSNPNTLGGTDVNEQAMIDFRLRVPHVDYLVPFSSGLQIYGEIASEDKWSKFPLPTQAAVLGGIYIPQLITGDSWDLRFEYADTDLSFRRTGIQNVWYNNFLYVSGMRYRGYPLGHWMGQDAVDYFLRTTRYLWEDMQLGLNMEYSERGMSVPVHEKKKEIALDLTWWFDPRKNITLTYTYQRLDNPGQISTINPYTQTFASGVVANNNFIWTMLTMEF